MDVERTIEFILEMQAKAEERATKSEKRMDKFDMRLEATRKLVEAGMKIVLKTLVFTSTPDSQKLRLPPHPTQRI